MKTATVLAATEVGYVEKRWLDFGKRVAHDTFAEVVRKCWRRGIEIFSDISTSNGVLVGEGDVTQATEILRVWNWPSSILGRIIS